MVAEGSVLVVTDDARERDRMADWLEDAGFGVMTCPGPTAPDYRCLGGLGHPCPLSEEADVVVLDMRLESDEMMAGSPGWELLLYYMAHGKKIVSLSDDDDVVHPRPDEGVVVIRRPATEGRLVKAVRAVQRASRARRTR